MVVVAAAVVRRPRRSNSEAEVIEEILAEAARGRRALLTMTASASVWQDRAAVDGAWRRWANRRPPGSVAPLPAAQGRPRFRGAPRIRGWLGVRREPQLVAPSPFEATPTRLVASVARALPDRWRVETRADDQRETGLLVVAGQRWWSAVRVLDADGTERIRTAGNAVPVVHSAIAEMLEADHLLSQLNVAVVGDVVHAGRTCVRLSGTLRDSDEIAIWPADSYDLYLDVEHGVLLRFAAVVDGDEAAVAVLSDTSFNIEIPDETFTRDPPNGISWRWLSAVQ